MQEQPLTLRQNAAFDRMTFYLPGSQAFAQGLHLYLQHTTEHKVLRPWYATFLNSIERKQRYLDIGPGIGTSLTDQADRLFQLGIAIEKDATFAPLIKAHCPNIQIIPQMWQNVTAEALRTVVAKVDATVDHSDDGIFDLVQAIHLLYYIPEAEHQRFLQKLTKLVRPGGTILVVLQEETSDYYALYHKFVPFAYNLYQLGKWFEAEFGHAGWRVTSEVLPGEVATDNLAIAIEIAEFMLCYVEFEPLPEKSAIERWVKARLWQPETGLYLAQNPQRVLLCQRLF